MKHVGLIAGRELRSLFYSPVAYVVLTLYSLLAGVFFLLNVLNFYQRLDRATQMQQFGIDQSSALNLNQYVILPFLGTMWIILVFLIPGITMGLFASEKANKTDELLMTSPLSIWEIVLGKFFAAAAFVSLLVGIVALFIGMLFYYGDPEFWWSMAGILGLLLAGLLYAAIGAFASSLTRNQMIAFIVAFVLGFLMLILAGLADLGSTALGGGAGALMDGIRYVSTANHVNQLLEGVVDTSDVAYFGVMIGTFLLLTKAAVESVRWR